MQLSDEELFKTEVGFQAFKTFMADKVGAYLTAAVAEENVGILLEFGAANIPGGIASAEHLGFWEISFRNCESRLKRDPAWKSTAQQRAEFEKMYDGLPAEEVKRRYANDPAFKMKVDQMKRSA